MDKFLIKSNLSSTTVLKNINESTSSSSSSNKDCIKSDRKVNNNDMLSMIKSTSLTSQSSNIDSWNNINNNIVNPTIMICNEKQKSMNASITGWKNINNIKTYTTFRNGKLIQASGYQGYKLSTVDSTKKTNNKVKDRSIEKDTHDNKENITQEFYINKKQRI